jgi:hypothetical protein
MNENTSLQTTAQTGLVNLPRDRVQEWHDQLARDIATRKITEATAQTYRRGLQRFADWFHTRASSGVLPDRKIVRTWVDELSAAADRAA